MGTRNITIQGISVSVNAPYNEGHVLKAREADTLNQTRSENISNNVRKTVKELIEKHGKNAKPHVQRAVSDYDKTYDLSVSGSGGSRLDPITKEAREIARAKIKEHLYSQGRKLAEYTSGPNKEKFDAEVLRVSQLPAIVAAATDTVNARSAGGVDIKV